MIGTTIDGKYRVVRQLGEGGMGAVYEAIHDGTGRRVALKMILNAEVADRGDLIVRFQREARAAGAIDTQHIVQVFDTGVDPTTRHPFMVMEYLAGEDLSQLVRRLGPLPPQLALRAVAQAALGLQKAHDAGVVHRDIKPANLFLCRREEGALVVKVLDFGIAKVTVDQISSAENASLTRTGSMLGSPLYMSPEQAKGARSVDHRTDIWSLGVVLYEALSGRPPNDHAESLGELILAICGERARSIQEVAPWVAPGVAEIVHKALEIQPSARFQSMAELFSALQSQLPGGSWALEERMLTGLSAQARSHIAAKLLSATTPMPNTPLPAIAGAGANERLSATADRGGHAISRSRGDGRHMHEARSATSLVVGLAALVVATAGAGVIAARRYDRHASAVPAASVGLEPSASSSAIATPSHTAAAGAQDRARRLAVEPADVAVEVDGAPATVEEGVVNLSGPPGSVHKVRLTRGRATMESDIIITSEGLSPERLALPPDKAAVSRPSRPSTSSVPTTLSSARAPQPPVTGVDRKTDEFR